MDQIQIADYLAKKVFNGELKTGYNIMLKNKQIYPASNYGRLVESNKISPEDAFVYINFSNISEDESYNDDPVVYLFPLTLTLKDESSIYSINGIVDSYLSKLGFYEHYAYDVSPAMGLRYYTVMILFSDRLVIELTDIDTMATNTGLRKIVEDVLGKGILTQKEISSNQIDEIIFKLEEQKVFAGHDVCEVQEIARDYYVYQNTSLAKEVLAIANAYNRIFEPYRVVYDTKTRQQVLM
jgi:hypothetical protein